MRTRPSASRHSGHNSTPNSTGTMLRASPSMGSALDPRLVDSTVKDELMASPHLRSADTAAMHNLQRNFTMSRPPYPILRSFGLPGAPGVMYNPYNRRDSLVTGNGDRLSPQSYRYPEPPSRRSNSSTPSPSKTSSTPGREVDEAAGYGEASNNKLKGVFWPGMDIFDSATLAARRRRNQKKDQSSINQLEIASKEVEPTELVFTTPNWELKKEKAITGNVDSSSSPFKPSPVKRETRADTTEAARKPYFGVGQLDRRKYKACDDHRVEKDLTYAPVGNKRKRRIPVFRDPDADYQDEDEEEKQVSFSCPSKMSHLTYGLDKENQTSGQHAPVGSTRNVHGFGFKVMDDSFLATGHQAPEHAFSFRSSAAMTNYHRQQYAQHQYSGMHTLNTLATAAATSLPYPTATNSYASNGGYNTHSGDTGHAGTNDGYGANVPNPYGIAYQSWQNQGVYQYQNSLQAATHQAAYSRSLSATAGPTHMRNLSNGFGYGTSANPSLCHNFAYASTDMPSMFATSNLWNNYAPAHGGYEAEQDNGSGSSNAFGHHNSAPMSTTYAAGSPTATAHIGEMTDTPGFRNGFMFAQGSNDVPIESVEDTKDDEDHGLQSVPAHEEVPSEDEGRTITAPATPKN
jgi:hypothetical protein